MFEYIGEMGKDYIYAVTPLLEDALMDRDLVHRQTACTTVKHISLGVAVSPLQNHPLIGAYLTNCCFDCYLSKSSQGLGCEDALTHLLNFVWPNIFEVSPHVINAVMEAVEGMMVALGPGRVLYFVLQGLFHPARRVRDVYWKIYNSLYIFASDAMTAAYPRLDDDVDSEGNCLRQYRRTHLEMVI
jgi:splicing factor 3B subunit 1